MQLTYPNDLAVALAGMKADEFTSEVESLVAFEDIPAGRAVVLRSDGRVELPKATTLTKVRGVSVYSPMVEQSLTGVATYKAGQLVPVMRKGKIYAEYLTGTQDPGGAINIRHSSTTATDRGKFTNAATSAVAGSEVSAAPEGIQTGPQAATVTPSGLVLVEINLPA